MKKIMALLAWTCVLVGFYVALSPPLSPVQLHPAIQIHD